MPSYDKNHPKIKQLVAKLQAWDEKYHLNIAPSLIEEAARRFVAKHIPNQYVKNATKLFQTMNLFKLHSNFIPIKINGWKVTVYAKTCKHSFDITRPQTKLCPICSPRSKNRTRHTQSSFEAALNTVTPNLKVIGVFTRMKDAIDIKCISCNHTWTARPYHLLYSKSGCPSCMFLSKIIKLNGKKQIVQGYEPSAINYLRSKGFRDKDIKVFSSGEVPKVFYKFKNRNTFHKPDIFIPSKNLLIEVKSLSTLGILPSRYGKSPREIFIRNKRKAKAALRTGYKYLLLVMNAAGERIRLPKDWYTYSHTALKEILT